MSLSDLEFQLGVLERKGEIEELEKAKKIYEDRSSEMMVKREEEYENTKYKTVISRIIAAIIDGLLLFFAYVLAQYVFGVELFNNSENSTLINTVLLLFPYIYSIVFHTAFGKTIGKMLSGVKVVTNRGEIKITLIQAFLRDCVPFLLVLLYTIPTLSSVYIIVFLANIMNILWPILEILTTFTNKKRRALHDFIAGTVVIHEK